MKQIKLVHFDGPFGDCTSAYQVYFPENITVEQFINTAIQENPDEWGAFILGTFGSTICQYNRGIKQVRNLEYYYKVKDCHINTAWAHGGWSLMDYTLNIKEKVEEGDNNDISYHQFAH